LKEKIIPSIEERCPDYDSIHRAKITLDFIEKNIPSHITPEDQASKFDDVWSFENVWSIIEMKLMKKDYEDLNQVKKEIKKIWKNFYISLCAKMILSIPRRLEAVIKNQGRRILKSDY
jgi:hypothetical protein